MAAPPWPEGLLSAEAKGFTVEGSKGVFKGVAVTVMEDWSMGSILHSGVCSPSKLSKVTLGLGRGWVKVMVIKSSYVLKEAAGRLDELGGLLFVSV